MLLQVRVEMLRNLFTTSVLIFSFACTALASEVESRPHIIIVLADDVGYGDIGIDGNPVSITPNLNRFAKEGIRFTQCYAGAPVCSLARIALLTGRSPYRVGMYSNIRDRESNTPGPHRTLPASELTIAELLQANGYETFFAGKWHVSDRSEGIEPAVRHGFDHVRGKGLATDLIQDFSDWLPDRDPGTPLFAILSLRETHEPVEELAPQEFQNLYHTGLVRAQVATLPYGFVTPTHVTRIGDPVNYFAALSQMDFAFGKLLDSLETNGMRENTLIVFTSDNGPEWREPNSFGSPSNLRGAKAILDEGGIRIPCYLQWPQRISGHKRVRTPVSHVDLLPTICRLTGTGVPRDRVLDGINIWPTIRGRSISRSIPLHWHFWSAAGGFHFAMRSGDWKLMGGTGPVSGQTAVMDHIRESELLRWRLTNLKDDPTESHNRVSSEVSTFLSLRDTAIALRRSVLAEGPTFNMESARPDGVVIPPEPDRGILVNGTWNPGGISVHPMGLGVAPLLSLHFLRDGTLEMTNSTTGDTSRGIWTSYGAGFPVEVITATIELPGETESIHLSGILVDGPFGQSMSATIEFPTGTMIAWGSVTANAR